jgi:hypothetical protein
LGNAPEPLMLRCEQKASLEARIDSGTAAPLKRDLRELFSS